MPGKILIVDDERLILTTIDRALAKLGYRTTTASNLAEVEAALTNGPFDLLITDVYLEDANAEDIIAKVSPLSPGLRVLRMSGSGQAAGRDFLEKPFMINDLRSRVRELLDEPHGH